MKKDTAHDVILFFIIAALIASFAFLSYRLITEEPEEVWFQCHECKTTFKEIARKGKEVVATCPVCGMVQNDG